MPVLPRQQMMIIAAIFAAVLGALLIVYLFFFRAPMVPIYQNIRQSDASAIVAELDKGHIAFELANEGHDVLVPEDRASDARVAVAGANVALGGTVGFELFDDSDMGLTEFAQKINFQRAMQGELARTIMMMQGVEFARVHLALPERSIFRAGQEEPTAAVTIQMMQGQVLTAQRIEGVQQLVAASVPGLAQAAVSILDDRGDLVSAVGEPASGVGEPLDARSALARYYEARAADALRRSDPDLRFEVTVYPRRSFGAAGETDAAPDRNLPDRTATALRVTVRTAEPLSEPAESRVRSVLTDALALELPGEDTIEFGVGPMGSMARSHALRARQTAPAPEPIAARYREAAIDRTLPDGWRLWAFFAAFVAILALSLRPRRRLDAAQAMSFADHLRAETPERGEAHAS